jgi:hypothetical protein
MIRTIRYGMAVLLALAIAAPAAAQAPPSLEQIQLNDIRGMKEKFVGLANAFPEAAYAYRPMLGAEPAVRSTKEVLILLIGEGYNFPTQWGGTRPPQVLADRAAETARLQAMNKAQLVEELTKSFDNMIAVVSGMDAAARAREIRFFGQPTTVGGAIMMATADMHEHLGQLIAYARVNHVVPPWS